MKNTTILLFILVSSNIFAQSKSIQENVLTEMVQHALTTILVKHSKEAILDSTSRELKNEVNIWIDHFPAGFEPTQEMFDLDINLKFISFYGLSNRQKRKGIEGIGFSGAIVNGDIIQLFFNRKYVLLSGKKLKTGIDGEGYYFEYQYSCEKREWILKSTTD